MAHAVLTREGEAFGQGVPESGELERAQRPGEVGADGIDRPGRGRCWFGRRDAHEGISIPVSGTMLRVNKPGFTAGPVVAPALVVELVVGTVRSAAWAVPCVAVCDQLYVGRVGRSFRRLQWLVSCRKRSKNPATRNVLRLGFRIGPGAGGARAVNVVISQVVLGLAVAS